MGIGNKTTDYTQQDVDIISTLADLAWDVAEHKLAEEEQQQSEEHYRLLSETMLQGVVYQDANGTIISMNPAAERILGKRRDQFLGSSSVKEEHDTLRENGESFPGLEHPSMVALRTGQPVPAVIMGVFNPKTSGYRWISIGAVPVFRSGETCPYEVFTVFEDITERKRAENALRKSEERFKQMFRNHSAVMLLMEPESGEIIDANLAAENFYGYTREGLLTLNISDINTLSPELIDTERHAALEGKRNHFIFPHRLADGDIRTVEVYSTPITVNNSTLLFSIVHDITERKRAEDALRESESEFRSLAEAMPQIVWVTRPDGWNIFFNKQWMDYTGMTLEESCGHGWIKPFHPDDRQRAWDAWQNATQNNDVYSLECRLRRADGVYKWWLVRGLPVQDTKGTILKWFGTCTDIHELKQVEQELQAKNTEMERFTYTVSHDLKSPLITIQSYAGMIAKDLETGKYERAGEDVKRIEGAAGKMTDLLNDLLQLSRVGRMMNEPSTIDMNRLVADTLMQLAGSLKQNQVEVVLQSDLPAVHGDPKRIAEVVQNLIENAIKYRGDQTAPRIEIGTRQEGTECVFFVSDNGKGIDPRHFEKVFGLFNKLDAESEGTGVGLALVQRIIEVHGGRVWVESEGEGLGSCFCFTVGD